MNTNNGKTGIIDIPGALHSTGGDGDGQIGGVVAYTGDIYDENLNRNQADINENVQIDLSKKLELTDNKSLVLGNTNNTTSKDSIASGVGVNITGDRSFGFGEAYAAIYLTGDTSSNVYTAKLFNKTNSNGMNKVADVFKTTHVNAYILETTNFTRVAKITAINWTDANNPLTVTLDTNLGVLTDGQYCIENIGGAKTFSVGTFGNIGTYSTVFGNGNYNTGNYSLVSGYQNTNKSSYSNVLGYWNKNAEAGASVMGYANKNAGQYPVVLGLENDNSGSYSVLLGRSNVNKCLSTNIIGYGNTVNETTYPSNILGINNIVDANAQSFILGYSNHGTRGTYAPANASCTFILGHNLTTSRGGIALGWYNKDYDVETLEKQNFLVVGQGTANQPLNTIEQKANGDLYVFGIGGFNGTNSDVNTVKTVQGKINDLQTQINNVNTSNFYTKSEIDAQNVITSTALNDLNDRVDINESTINDLNDNVNSLQETVDELNEKAIKLNEYDEVNITYPENEEREGYILCNLVKDDEKIIQDYPDSDFADSVRNGNFYIGTNFGNDGISEDEFDGYILDEEITNVNDPNDKSIILDCFKLNGYWVLETESELTASNNLYSALGNYYKQHMITPFRLESDGSLYLMNVGNYNGDQSTTHESQSLQEVIDSNLSLLDSNNNLIINSKSEVESTATNSLIGGIATVGKGEYAFGFGGNAQKAYISGNASDGYQLQLNVTSSFVLTNYIRPIFESIYKDTYLLDANTYEKVAKITAVTPNTDG